MSDSASPDRLESWKEIAAYLRRDVTTVQRWERREGMPVHRHVHDKSGSVYAFRTELDAWTQGRKARPVVEDTERGAQRPRRTLLFVATGAVIGAALMFGLLRVRDRSPENPLVDARFLHLTNFGGSEQAAALSRDGRFVAFLSNRDGRMDVWVTQIGTGQSYNLTRKTVADLTTNPSVRTLGFSPDGALVTFWTRSSTDASNQSAINIRSAPVLGGPSRPYLEGVAEFDWSADGTRLVYHTPGPGDPMFVRDPGQEAKQIFSAPAGLHAHFPVWSPDGAFIYFVQGAVPDRMDVWRIPQNGGTPERITHHDSRVSHPVFLGSRTLLYLATEADGSGPWLYSIDLNQRQPRRASFGLERYTSVAASADGRRLVATLASAKSTLWRFPVTDAPVEGAAGARLTNGYGSSPRFGTDYLLYVSSKDDSDSIWKLQGDEATELWSAPETKIIGAPSIAPDGHRIGFSTRRGRETSLYVVNADGTNALIVARSLELHGTPAWAPDGQSMIVAAIVNGAPRLFTVPLGGGSPSPFAENYAVDPLWSPSGDFVVYSGPDIGTISQVRAVTRTGSAFPLPNITLTRGSRHLAFMPGGRSVAVLRGEMGHKNLSLIDLTTGEERPLTNLSADFGLRDFDISPDGRHIVLEQVHELSDIVLIELARR